MFKDCITVHLFDWLQTHTHTERPTANRMKCVLGLHSHKLGRLVGRCGRVYLYFGTQTLWNNEKITFLLTHCFVLTNTTSSLHSLVHSTTPSSLCVSITLSSISPDDWKSRRNQSWMVCFFYKQQQTETKQFTSTFGMVANNYIIYHIPYILLLYSSIG